MASRVIPVEDFDLVIFGVTGDLARRKIIPALYRRFVAGQMPGEARVFGAARADLSQDEFRAMMAEALSKSGADPKADCAKGFLESLGYMRLDVTGGEGWSGLSERLRRDRAQVFYLSVAPGLFPEIVRQLKALRLNGERARVVVEKPFGHDRESAAELNRILAECFSERQIYRIDHYLGKETVQNLMALRFANVLFEPLWNSRFIDHVQITVAEEVGVEGRGGYYDRSGAMRDMMQNHLMQLLCLIAMEPPSVFEPNAVRDEKLKVIRALDPVDIADTVRGQYVSRNAGDSYVDHAGNPKSTTESYVAIKASVSNWRWAGTPFYLRTGKRLKARRSKISIAFKSPPHLIFESRQSLPGNELVIRLQPDEGITMHVTIKEPGPGGMRMVTVPLDMSFADDLGHEAETAPDAYERLIMDVVRGNQTLFMRGDEVEAAWEWVDPIIRQWAEAKSKPQPYDSGSSGPEDGLMLMHRDGRKWRDLELRDK